MKIHIVQSQDTLSDLAKKYNVPVERIIEANADLQQELPLEMGSKIFIPTGKVSLAKNVEEQHQPSQHHQGYEQEEEKSRSNESSAYEWDSSTHNASYPHEYDLMHAESYFAEHAGMTPPLPSTPGCDSSYHMWPANPYIPPGHISGVPMSPCYYPYPMMPYHFDPYQQMQLSYHTYPSYDYDDYWDEESEQGDLWTLKESSSAIG